MTKMLEIVGTDIRLEIEDCADCPCHEGDIGNCGLTDRDTWEPDWPIAWCPLPEKTDG